MDVKKVSLVLMIAFLILFLEINVEAMGINLNILADSSTVNCAGYFGSANEEGTLMNLLVNNVFVPIRWLVPILLLIFTTMDFSKVVFSESKDGMEKAKKNFVKRAIVSVVIFFIPTILEILFGLIDNQAIQSCMHNFN